MGFSSAAELGAVLREERLAAGLTQTRVAERARVSQRWLSRLETGHPTTGIGKVLAVCRALGVGLDVVAAVPLQEPDVNSIFGPSEDA